MTYKDKLDFLGFKYEVENRHYFIREGKGWLGCAYFMPYKYRKENNVISVYLKNEKMGHIKTVKNGFMFMYKNPNVYCYDHKLVKSSLKELKICIELRIV